MGNTLSVILEDLKSKVHPILLVNGVRVKSKEVVKFLQKVETECTTLEEIHVTSCKLKVIPPNLIDLKQLKILNCDANKISKVPYSLDKHTNLRELILSNNLFVEFPREILSIPTLTSINLSHNQIAWFPELSNLKVVLPAIREIKLDSNGLTTFPSQLCCLETLITLTLTDNKIDTIPEEINQLTSLQTLSLANNSFTKFPGVLYTLPVLTNLNLSNNQLSTVPPIPIGGSLPITTLDLKHNTITSLSEGICNMTSLAVLRLNDNKITSISEHVSRLTKLRELHLAENEIERLPVSIGHCTTLKKLYLEFNEIKFLPQEIVNLSNLVVLILHHNSLTNLPSELRQMNQLLTLSLDENPFDDEELRAMIKVEGSLAVVFSSVERSKSASKSATNSPSIGRRSPIMNISPPLSVTTTLQPAAPNKIHRARSRSHENIHALYDSTARFSGSFVKLSPLAEETIQTKPPNSEQLSRRRHSGVYLAVPHQFAASTASTSPISSPATSPIPSVSSKPMSITIPTKINTAPQSSPILAPSRNLLPDPKSPSDLSLSSPPSWQLASSPTQKQKKSNSLTSLLTRSKSDLEEDKIPPYSSFKAAFETLLDEQDFSRKRRLSLGELSKEDKWAMLAQYKWDSLEMLRKGNTNQSRNNNSSGAQFFTLRRGIMPKAASFKTPKEYCSALSGIMLPPVSVVKEMLEMLVEGGRNALEFMDIGGISLLVDLLSRLYKETGYSELIIGLLNCMEALIDIGLSAVLTTLDSISVITGYLSYGVAAVTKVVQSMMIEILQLYNIGYKVISEALLANQHTERAESAYDPFVKIFKSDFETSIKEQTLIILGCLMEYSGSLELNFTLECELHKLHIEELFQEMKNNPILRPPIESFEKVFAQHTMEMSAIYGRKAIMARLGQKLAVRDDIIRVSLHPALECEIIPVNKNTTAQDILSVILKKYPEYYAKNVEWGLSNTEYSMQHEPKVVWLDNNKTLASYRIGGDDILDFKIRRLSISITLKPDVLMPAPVEVEPEMLISEATRTLLTKFQLFKKKNTGQEEYWNEYGMFMYEKGKYEAGFWLDENKKVLDYNYTKQLVGLRLKKNTININFGKLQQALSFDPEMEIQQIRNQIYKFIAPRSTDPTNCADRYGLYMEYPAFMNKPAEWLVNNKKLKGYYIPKECVVQLMRKPVPITVKAGIFGQPTQKVTIDIGNKVEDEILKLTMLPIPAEFDVLHAKEGSDELTTLILEVSFREQKVVEGATLSIKPKIREDVNIWLEPKGGDNEVFEARPDGTQAIVSGTFNKLIEYLTSPDFFDLQVRDVFLNTYSSFTNVTILLEKLAQRYATPAALDSMMSVLIKQRVLVFIKNWIKFENDSMRWNEFENTCEHFFSKHGSKAEYEEVHQIFLKCIKERPKPVTYQHNTQPPKPKLPKILSFNDKLTWWDMDENEVARQITLLLFSQYSKIEHYELLNQIWMKSPEKAPCLTELISSFNKISKWVIGAILAEKGLKSRTKMYTKMIKIAKCLRELNNYYALMAFISALNNAAISRLKHTRAGVNTQNLEALAQLEKLMSMEGSFKEYRTDIQEASPPCIPYVGVHLSDLVFIAEGNPKTVGHRINVDRLNLESGVISSIRRYQKIPYNLKSVDTILDFFATRPLLEEKEAFDVSLQCEPRNGPIPQYVKPPKDESKEKEKEKDKEECSMVMVGPNFWNVRGSHAHMMGLVDIGTHMSLIKLDSGKFLVIDTMDLSPQQKKDVDLLTANGTKIEAVLCTHPFHTLYCESFYRHYPNAAYYGTPRHLRVVKNVPWVGDLKSPCHRARWLPEVDMTIPDGAEFVAPLPEKTNHFSCVFVFHAKSRTIHLNDTIMIGSHPGVLLKLGGFRHGDLSFHPSIKGPGLYPTENAPFLFRDWIRGITRNWDFDNIVASHMGNKIGGAKAALIELIDKSENKFQKLSKRNIGVFTPSPAEANWDLVAEGCECG